MQLATSRARVILGRYPNQLKNDLCINDHYTNWCNKLQVELLN